MDYAYDEELDIAIYTASEDVRYADIRDAIQRYYNGTLTAYTIWDFSNPKIRLLTEEVKRLAQQVQELGAARPNGYDAIVVSSHFQYGLASMYIAYSEMFKGNTRLRTGVFLSKKEALKVIRAQGKKRP